MRANITAPDSDKPLCVCDVRVSVVETLYPVPLHSRRALLCMLLVKRMRSLVSYRTADQPCLNDSGDDLEPTHMGSRLSVKSPLQVYPRFAKVPAQVSVDNNHHVDPFIEWIGSLGVDQGEGALGGSS